MWVAGGGDGDGGGGGGAKRHQAAGSWSSAGGAGDTPVHQPLMLQCCQEPGPIRVVSPLSARPMTVDLSTATFCALDHCG